MAQECEPYHLPPTFLHSLWLLPLPPMVLPLCPPSSSLSFPHSPCPPIPTFLKTCSMSLNCPGILDSIMSATLMRCFDSSVFASIIFQISRKPLMFVCMVCGVCGCVVHVGLCCGCFCGACVCGVCVCVCQQHSTCPTNWGFSPTIGGVTQPHYITTELPHVQRLR